MYNLWTDNILVSMNNSSDGYFNGREYATFIIIFCVVCNVLISVLLVPPQHVMPYKKSVFFFFCRLRVNTDKLN